MIWCSWLRMWTFAVIWCFLVPGYECNKHKIIQHNFLHIRVLNFPSPKNTTSQALFDRLLIQSISGFSCCIHSESMGPWWIASLMQQMRLPLDMQAIQSHLHSLGQANLIMNAVMIGRYTWVVDHSCSLWMRDIVVAFIYGGCKMELRYCMCCLAVTTLWALAEGIGFSW